MARVQRRLPLRAVLLVLVLVTPFLLPSDELLGPLAHRGSVVHPLVEPQPEELVRNVVRNLHLIFRRTHTNYLSSAVRRSCLASENRPRASAELRIWCRMRANTDVVMCLNSVTFAAVEPSVRSPRWTIDPSS